MADEKKGATVSPPYLGFGTFKNYIGDLAATTIPPRIDKSMMKGKSGGTQAALLVAFSFLGLTGEKGVATQALRDLVEAHGTERWPAALKKLLDEHYGPILKGVPLDRGTAGQLDDAFEKHTDFTKSTRAKAISFYLRAGKEAQIELSPHFRAPSVPKRKRKKKEPAKDATSAPDAADDGVDNDPGDGNGDEPGDSTPVPDGWLAQPFNLPGRRHPVRVVIPSNLTAKEWKMVSTYMALYVEEANE